MQSYADIASKAGQTLGQRHEEIRGGGDQTPPLPQQFEQVKGRLADSLGATCEAAKTVGLPKEAAHEIVNRAFSGSW